MESNERETYEKITSRVPAKELSTLLEVSSSLASTMDLTEVLQIAIQSAAELLGLNTGAVYTLEDGVLVLGAAVPPIPPELPDEHRRARLDSHPHIRKTVLTKAPVYIRDAREVTLTRAERIIVEQRELVSILYFPMLLKENAIGVFILGATDTIREFTSNEIDLSHVLAFQVSLAIANAQLYKKAQEAVTHLTQAYDATLEGWSRMLDMRDHVTDEHTHRAADLTVALARKMGIPESELGHIRRGALMHDIGKIGIPDAILQKPSALSEEELKIMQSHPEKAYQVLSQINYLAPALDIPYSHHERWDGTGYPRKIGGDQIPLAARLFAVVDVFDALTSDRPYRKAWSKEKALEYIREQSGKHFDPEVVKAFNQLLEELS